VLEFFAVFVFSIARRLKVAVQNVRLHRRAKHGDSEMPLWSMRTWGNIPRHEWAVAGHGKLTRCAIALEIFQNVKTLRSR